MVLSESQCGFRSERGCVDMIFSAHQVQEKYIEQQVHLYHVFVDMTKLFDTVNMGALWNVLDKLDFPLSFVHMVKEFHRKYESSSCIQCQLLD